MSNDRVTWPSSFVEHFIRWQQEREQALDEATLHAPWVERYLATLKSSLKKWCGTE
jgi:hypothetical protein